MHATFDTIYYHLKQIISSTQVVVCSAPRTSTNLFKCHVGWVYVVVVVVVEYSLGYSLGCG